GHAVNGHARRHRTRDARQPLTVAGYSRACVLCDDRKRVAGCDEEVAAENQVAVAVAVAGRAEVGRSGAAHACDQLRRVYEVRVRVVAAEIRQGLGVHDCAFGRAQTLFEYVTRVRARDRAHRVEENSEAARDVRAQGVEVEQLLHDRRVVFERVDDEDIRVRDTHAPFAFEVNVRAFEREVACDGLCPLVDALGHRLGRGAAVARVVLDAEVFVYAAGVVARGEHETAEGFAPTYDGGYGG